MSSGSGNKRDALVRALIASVERLSSQDALFHQAAAARLGLHLTDWKTLSLLLAQGSSTAGRLAEVMGLTTGAITGVLDRLEKAGLARRVRNEEDRRQVFLEPNPDREGELRKVLAPLQQTLRTTWQEFSEEQLNTVDQLLTRTAEAIHAEAGKLRPEAAEPVAAVDEEGAFTAPIGKLKSARFRMSAGASRVKVRVVYELDSLYRARFEGKAPKIKVENGEVQMKYGGFAPFDWTRASGDILLTPRIPWAIEFKGGASKVDTDLSLAKLLSLDFTGGVSQVVCTLPLPHGIVPIRISGGASHVTLKRPKAAAMKLEIKGGVSKLRFDEQQFGAIGGRTTLTSSNWTAAEDRYELEMTGGASDLQIFAEG